MFTSAHTFSLWRRSACNLLGSNMYGLLVDLPGHVRFEGCA